MFRNAIALARKFTYPVIINRLTVGGKCSSSIGAYVLINSEGWIVTAGHILEQITKLDQETALALNHEKRVAEIRGDEQLDPKERSRQLRDLGKLSPDATRRFSAWWGGSPGAVVKAVAFIQAVDIGVCKLEPFQAPADFITPVFKDPTKNFEPGAMLCKLGFPFHSVNPAWDESQGQFILPPGALPLPLFPIEGMFTRTQIMPVEPGQVNAVSFPLKRIETSSPGLRGQSGGPIFDVEGSIWGIQCVTAHLPLGFDPPVPGGRPGEKEHQFLNLGFGVHPETIFGLFRQIGVRHFQISSY